MKRILDIVGVVLLGLLMGELGYAQAESTDGAEAQPGEEERYIPDGRSVPPFEKVDDNRIRIGKVIVNHATRTVSFDAVVNMEGGIMEYICCMPNGKVHEALLLTDADPLHISLGMTLLKFHRFEKFFPERGEDFEWLPFKEPKPEDYADSHLQIEMSYMKDKKLIHDDFSEIIINAKTRKGLSTKHWLYTNSYFYQGAYQASFTGEVIAIFASRTSPINYIGDFHDGVNETGWIINPTKKLTPGTKVTITISQKKVEKEQ